MGRVSSVKRLPPELRECIGKLRGQGKTLDEILEHLRRLDSDLSISRSALGRYTKQYAVIAAEMEKANMMAEALVREQRDQPAGTTARLNMQLMHTAVYRLLSRSVGGDDEGGEPVTFSPQEAMQLWKALEHASRAAKTDAEYTAKIREEIRREEAAKLEKAAARVGAESTGESLSLEAARKRIMAICRGEE